MFCKKCSAPIEEGKIYCSKCSKKESFWKKLFGFGNKETEQEKNEGRPDFLRKTEEYVTSFHLWKCPKCGKIMKKGALGDIWHPGDPITKVGGTGTCGSCSANFPQAEIYGGKYDVGEKTIFAKTTVPDPDASKEEKIAIIKAGNIDEKTLIIALKDNDYWVRIFAAEALGKIGTAETIPALIELLKDSDEQVRENTARILGEIREPESVPALIEALKDENVYVRIFTAEALGKIGTPEAVPVLIESLKDSDWQVREKAASALGKIGDSKAVSALTEALKDSSESVRERASEALDKVGTLEVVPTLLEALKGSDVDVRFSAVNALGKILDKHKSDRNLLDSTKAKLIELKLQGKTNEQIETVLSKVESLLRQG